MHTYIISYRHGDSPRWTTVGKFKARSAASAIAAAEKALTDIPVDDGYALIIEARRED